MANNKIEESQQKSQGVAMGTQGNQDITTPQGTKGSHHEKGRNTEQNIPNQERSSAANQEKNQRGQRQDQ